MVSVSRHGLPVHCDTGEAGTPVTVKRLKHFHLIISQLEVENLHEKLEDIHLYKQAIEKRKISGSIFHN